ncbi:ATP-binding protein [Methylovorus glucosotrophus]|uniref:histidine kinase n=1 Tax=Methylovorus glucosotrophus (strain SIP3-4) TaxID=582744 RepID=C6XE59_METGS|nr:ATP-binding protein [Methylovorus glucosotrophus]ACT50834.1 multi-sensor signal transduction histidine kinase [Methylovorus glucosotrophus SIP3-4]
MQISVNLHNCDQEPIHLAGAIQSYGALLAFDLGGTLQYCSENATEFLGDVPMLGQSLQAHHLSKLTGASSLISDYLISQQNTRVCHIHAPHGVFELMLHVAAGDMVVAEIEPVLAGSDQHVFFSTHFQQLLNDLRDQTDIETLLQRVTDHYRELTGFDRVMAYRFRQDGSGEVVAEARHSSLEDWRGRRYPAADIPQQARRLYLLNTLRLIADVDEPPVTLLQRPGMPPLDMSFCQLRSVSPIHIEYLQNMGVAASMSISIVIDGQLWGMIACHHMQPHRISREVRMSCHMLGTILSSEIQRLQAVEAHTRREQVAELRVTLLPALMDAEDFGSQLRSAIGDMAGLIPSDAAVISYDGKSAVTGDVPEAFIRAWLFWLNQSLPDVYATHKVEDVPANLRSVMGDICGVMAISIDKVHKSWLLFIRRELIHTIRWGGKPEKQYKIGPLGPRLTPRGSFAEWKETVQGQSEAWSPLDVAMAQELRMDLLKTCNAHNARNERHRIQLMAMLGHDLRDPLNSITMAAQMLEMQDGASSNKLGERIKNSSMRMKRLVHQVLDMSRLQAGLGLPLDIQPTDISLLVRDMLAEHVTAYPDIQVEADIPDNIEAQVDADRIAQVLSNLLSNARHHGLAGQPVRVLLSRDMEKVNLHVKNAGPEIPAETVGVLFDPFKRRQGVSERNKSGLGLGLYIAHQIIAAHQGDIRYEHAEGYVSFIVHLPCTILGDEAAQRISH